jgi:hypothetical protein
MHVRIARFENVDMARVDEDAEMFRRMLRSDERPEFMPEDAYATLRAGVVRVISLVDRSAGATVDLVFTRNEEDARRVDETLDGLSPPEGVGRRASVETLEVLFDEDLV